MPLLDHFNPPLHPRHHWESFHSNWATRLADALNERWLPPGFMAEEYTHAGARLEIDVATFEDPSPPASGTGGAPVMPLSSTWAPPAAAVSIPAIFPDTFEVRIFTNTGGMTLVAAIELMSPGNKDRLQERRAFASKCAAYLQQGVGIAVIDIVTTRRANLHNETMRLLEAPTDAHMSDEETLYATACRPVLRGERAEIDIWKANCSLGAPLPTMPLRLTGDLFVPIDFESTYQEACRRRRLA